MLRLRCSSRRGDPRGFSLECRNPITPVATSLCPFYPLLALQKSAHFFHPRFFRPFLTKTIRTYPYSRGTCFFRFVVQASACVRCSSFSLSAYPAAPRSLTTEYRPAAWICTGTTFAKPIPRPMSQNVPKCPTLFPRDPRSLLSAAKSPCAAVPQYPAHAWHGHSSLHHSSGPCHTLSLNVHDAT